MLSRLRQYIKNQGLIKSGDSIIAGVSGGPDSMALLHLLQKLQQEIGFCIYVAHLNHGLREEAAEEEDFVRNYCKEHSLVCFSRTINIKELAYKEKKSLEEAGRDCRYQYFFDLMSELAANRIATAHHQDDLAESVLLHLLRGSGIKGLRGIMPQNGHLIRPLLCFSKREIMTYLEENDINYCVDRSNFESEYLRNRIRLELLPCLQKEYNPRIIETLNRLADIARVENDAMEQHSLELWKRTVLKEEANTVILDNKALLEMHPAWQRRLILLSLGALTGENGWNMHDVQSIMDLSCKEGSSRLIHLRQGVRARKSYQELHFTIDSGKNIAFEYEISVPGCFTIPETGDTYILELSDREHFQAQAGDFYLDFDKLDSRLFLRSRKNGDIFSPAAMQGRKKLKDFFIDIKLPVEYRDKVALLCSNEHIYAVLGYRISRHAAVDSNTKRILLIKKKTRTSPCCAYERNCDVN